MGCPVRRGRHRWPPGRPRQGFSCKVRADQETGRQACRQEHAHPEKDAKLDTRETRCQVQSVQRAQDPALPRVLVQEVCYHVCLGSWRRRGKAVASRCHRHGIVGKKARIRSRGAGRVYIHQDWDKRKEAVVARRGTRGRNQARQEGQDRRVRRACRGRNPAGAAVWKVRRPDVREMPQRSPPEMGQGPPHNGQRGPAQDQGSQEVLGGARRSGDPVPAHRHAEAQRSRVHMEGCKVPARHFRTLRDAGGPDACGVRVFQDLFDQA